MSLLAILRRQGIILVAVAVSLLLFGFVAWYFGVRVWRNNTESMPLGWYIFWPSHDPRRGDIVAACPPGEERTLGLERGYLGPGPCNGAANLLKIVAGIPGDLVVVTNAGVCINGHHLSHSARLQWDQKHRPVPQIPSGQFRIPPGGYWLASPHPASWDSRYYGPLSAGNITYEGHPLSLIVYPPIIDSEVCGRSLLY